MTDYSKLVPIPPPEDINSGMTPVSASAMLTKFGVPGVSNPDCGHVTNKRLQKRIKTMWVGPFQATGMDVAVDALHRAFLALKQDGNMELFNAIKSAGMICVRKRRTSNQWSNHAWGTGIDLYCGHDVVPQGDRHTHLGLLEFYPYMHAQGFYWGAEFSGASCDAMHWELSAEAIAKIEY